MYGLISLISRETRVIDQESDLIEISALLYDVGMHVAGYVDLQASIGMARARSAPSRQSLAGHAEVLLGGCPRTILIQKL